MTVVTPPPTSDGDPQQQPQSPSNSPFEWKTLIETFSDNTNSTKYNELIQSISRWFVKNEIPTTISVFVIII
jgi:hypothetical protein